MTAEGGATATLAEWASSTTYADIPASVRSLVQRHVLDQLGVGLAGSTLPWSRRIVEYAEQHGGPGPCSVLGTPLLLDAELAALCNASAGHGFEMDDYCTGTMAHPGCVAVPVALAMGQDEGRSGADVVLAATLGLELIVRMARATMPGLLVDRGFHMTSVHGVIGAAGAAGRLLDLDPPTTTMALSIAASHASGIAEYAQTGGEVKRLHAGIGASNGIRAARLAALGLTGPPTALEGRRGMLQAFAPNADASELVDGLGTRWAIEEHLSIKVHCCCGSIMPMVDALQAILTDHRIGWSDVQAVRVGASEHSMLHVGAVGPAPTDMLQAQFSAHFSLGLAAVRGANDVATYLEAERSGFGDPDVLDFAKRVQLELDQEVEAAVGDGGYLGKVSVVTGDGRTLTHTTFAKGSMHDPLTDAEVAAKATGNATLALGGDGGVALVEAVRALPESPDLDGLTRAIRQQD